MNREDELLRQNQALREQLSRLSQAGVGRTERLKQDSALEEEDLCGVDTSGDERRGVEGYLEDWLYERSVGTVCEGCKDRAVSFADRLTSELEAVGLFDQAEEYDHLADTLSRVTAS